jgi:hypothetical protein
MTKKSLGRLQRDAEAKQIKDARSEVAEQITGNTIYDGIHENYEACGRVLVGYAQGFNELNIKQAQPHFSQEQRVKVDTLASGFCTDIKALQGDLIKIRAPFVDKKGGEMDVDSYMQVLDTVEQFQEFIGRANGVLDPTLRSIAAEVISVQMAAAQDPKVITDVEVKNVAA